MTAKLYWFHHESHSKFCCGSFAPSRRTQTNACLHSSVTINFDCFLEGFWIENQPLRWVREAAKFDFPSSIVYYENVNVLLFLGAFPKRQYAFVHQLTPRSGANFYIFKPFSCQNLKFIIFLERFRSSNSPLGKQLTPRNGSKFVIFYQMNFCF